MIAILLSILGWGLMFWLSQGKKCNVPFTIRGGGGGGDSPPIPTRQSPETMISGSPLLSELNRMVREYVGKSLSIPTEWSQYGNILQNLLNYVPELTYLTEPSEYSQMSEGLNRLLGYQPQLLPEPTEYATTGKELQRLLGIQPEQFAYPLEDIRRALEAEQSLGLDRYLRQVRPIMATQGQLDSSAYTNLISDYLRNQEAQRYNTIANLLTNQAGQNFQLQQWLPQYQANIAQLLQGLGGARAGIGEYNIGIQNALPQYQANILSQLGNLGQVRQGTQQYNVALKNALAQWLPNWQQNIASNIGNLGTSKLGLQEYNLMLPLSTYIPGLAGVYNMGQNAAETAFQDQLLQYRGALNEYNQKQAQRSAFGGIGGNLLGAGIGALATAGTGGIAWPIGAMLGSSIGGTLSPLWGGSGQSMIPLSTSLGYAFPQKNTMDLASIFGNTGIRGGSNYGLDLSGLISSRARPSWANTKLGRQLYNWQ